MKRKGKSSLKKWDLHQEEGFLDSFDKNTRLERSKRLAFLNDLWGKYNREGIWFGGAAYIFFEEAKNNFIIGSFVSCILIIQSFFEETLKQNLRMGNLTTDRRINNLSFKELIELSEEKALIKPVLKDDLNRLRKLRNPYVHSRGFKTTLKVFPVVNEKNEISMEVEKEAKFAIKLVFNYIKGKYGKKMFF